MTCKLKITHGKLGIVIFSNTQQYWLYDFIAGSGVAERPKVNNRHIKYNTVPKLQRPSL